MGKYVERAADHYPDFVTYMHPLHPQSEIVAKALGFIVGYILSTGWRIFTGKAPFLIRV